MRRALFFVIIGLGGAAILVSLGLWQVQRLGLKQTQIAVIADRITADPVALPDAPDRLTDAYLPVIVTGLLGSEGLRVLVSERQQGAGYRIVSTLRRAHDTILVDLGFLPLGSAGIPTPETALTIIGNLQWPQETDRFTPVPDLVQNIWFARDVDAMATLLDARPIMVVARTLSITDVGVTPLPVDTARIPNDHLQYAITWFSLAVVWLAMSAYFLRRRAPLHES